MKFKDELINNLSIPETNYVDLDYAMDRLEDEGKTNILKDIPNDRNITDGENYISMEYLIGKLENDEKPKYEIRG